MEETTTLPDTTTYEETTTLPDTTTYEETTTVAETTAEPDAITQNSNLYETSLTEEFLKEEDLIIVCQSLSFCLHFFVYLYVTKYFPMYNRGCLPFKSETLTLK